MHSHGDITICRADTQGAYHARGFNTNSLGIEILVPGIHNYGTFLEAIKTGWCTEAAFKSAVEKVREWMKLYDISVENIKRHSDLSPGRKLDPGEGFDWDRFIGALNE